MKSIHLSDERRNSSRLSEIHENHPNKTNARARVFFRVHATFPATSLASLRSTINVARARAIAGTRVISRHYRHYLVAVYNHKRLLKPDALDVGGAARASSSRFR
jgi:hypothetical protein